MSPVTVLVALEQSVDTERVEASLSGAGVQIVGFVHGLEDESNPQQDAVSDVLVLACGEASEEALAFVRSATARRPERPVVVLSHAGDNGHVERVFEAGADDLVEVSQNGDFNSEEISEHVAFVLQKAVARKSGGSYQSATPDRAPDLRAGAEGRDRQDADRLQPRGGIRRARRQRDRRGRGSPVR